MKKVEDSIKGRPMIYLTWYQMQVTLIITFIYNGILFLFSIGILIKSFQIYTNIGSFINLISENYYGTVITVLLVIVGVLCILFHITGALILLKSIFIHKSKKFNHVLYAFVLISVALILIILCITIAIISHSYGIHETLEDGILSGMQNYASDLMKKRKIDHMQVKFQCCGSKTYQEWFDIEWFDPMFIDSDITETLTDSAPFSCCKLASLYPCIHHHITNTSLFYDMNPNELTINNRGCHKIITSEIQRTGWGLFLTLLCLSILEGGFCIGMRIIQTAHSNTFSFEKETKLYSAWIFKSKTNEKEVAANKPIKPPTPPPLPPELMD